MTLTISITNTTLVGPFEGLEPYSLNAYTNGSWLLKAAYYPGFLRGIETFSQFFKLSDTDEYYV